MAGYNPGNFKVSMKKIKYLFIKLNLSKEEIKSVKKNLKKMKNTLKLGDMQLAKIINLSPLQIACYSDEFDSVLIYEYPEFLVEKYSLKINEYMVCSNSYWPKDIFSVEGDIILGKYSSNAWRDVITFIPLFLCDEKQEIYAQTVHSHIFYDEEINHFELRIKEYLEKKPDTYRYGFKTLIRY